mgnify:FL=1
MRCKRGDIVLALFPNSDLQTAKKRPVLIVQASDLNTGLSQRVVAMVSSNMARAGHPSRVKVSINTSEGKKTGLLCDSVIMTDNLATILENELDRVIGHMDRMDAVDAALCSTLGLK